MLKITQSSINEITVTLTELCVLSNPYYLFKLECQQTKQLFYFIGTDVSLFKDRYNKFLVEEKVSPNPLLGEVYLNLKGFYNYTVYEQASSTNLDPSLSGGIVEKGILKVFGTDRVSYKHTPEETTYIAYKG